MDEKIQNAPAVPGWWTALVTAVMTLAVALGVVSATDARSLEGALASIAVAVLVVVRDVKTIGLYLRDRFGKSDPPDNEEEVTALREEFERRYKSPDIK